MQNHFHVYDADLFFANLDSSRSDSEPNVAAEMSSMDADGGDGEQDLGDEIAEVMTKGSPHLAQKKCCSW